MGVKFRREHSLCLALCAASGTEWEQGPVGLSDLPLLFCVTDHSDERHTGRGEHVVGVGPYCVTLSHRGHRSLASTHRQSPRGRGGWTCTGSALLRSPAAVALPAVLVT